MSIHPVGSVEAQVAEGLRTLAQAHPSGSRTLPRKLRVS